MPKFDANLGFLFDDVPFLDRFERAAKAGFKGVEYASPYDIKPEVIAEKLKQDKLEQVLFNMPAGNWKAGERGIGCLPDRKDEFKKGVEQALAYAKALKCTRVNALSGLAPTNISEKVLHDTFVENLKYAAGAFQKAGVLLVMEAINTQDMPGFYLNNTKQAVKIIEEVGSPNLKFQYDIYHMQIMEGNLTKNMRDNIKYIGHMQLADNPGRNEPGTGEINFTNLFKFIDEAGYTGWIGCEYKPKAKTEEGLGWMSPYVGKGK